MRKARPLRGMDGMAMFEWDDAAEAEDRPRTRIQFLIPDFLSSIHLLPRVGLSPLVVLASPCIFPVICTPAGLSTANRRGSDISALPRPPTR